MSPGSAAKAASRHGEKQGETREDDVDDRKDHEDGMSGVQFINCAQSPGDGTFGLSLALIQVLAVIS